MDSHNYKAFVVEEDNGRYTRKFKEREVEELADNEVLINVDILL